ncbi:MAG: response regulator [Akkermansiaceae bacterium]
MNRSCPLILVVDDHESLRESFLEVLAMKGYETQGAEDGESALALVEQTQPDLVIMDHQLPGILGAEAIKIIKKACPVLPVIGFSTDDHESVMRAAGADRFLAKPVAMGDLIEEIEALLPLV